MYKGCFHSYNCCIRDAFIVTIMYKGCFHSYNEIPTMHSLYGNDATSYVVCVRCRRCILVAISWLPALHWVVLSARQHGCPSGDTPIFDRVGPLHGFKM